MSTTQQPNPQVQNSIEALMTSLVTGLMVPEHLENTHALFVGLIESEGHTWSDYELGYANACIKALEVGMILGGPRG